MGRLRDTQRAGVWGTAAGPEVSESPRVLSVQESAEDGLATGATGEVLAAPSAEAGGGQEAGAETSRRSADQGRIRALLGEGPRAEEPPAFPEGAGARLGFSGGISQCRVLSGPLSSDLWETWKRQMKAGGIDTFQACVVFAPTEPPGVCLCVCLHLRRSCRGG